MDPQIGHRRAGRVAPAAAGRNDTTPPQAQHGTGTAQSHSRARRQHGDSVWPTEAAIMKLTVASIGALGAVLLLMLATAEVRC